MKLFLFFITLHIAIVRAVHNLLLHQECAKTEGESCGEAHGTCVPGLKCYFPCYGPDVEMMTGPQKGECISKIYIIHYVEL